MNSSTNPSLSYDNPIAVNIVNPVEKAELDEMLSFVQFKQLDHQSEKILADVPANHQDEAYLKLRALLILLGIQLQVSSTA